MLTSITLATLRAASRAAAPMMASRAPVFQAATARYASRFMGGTPYAVDAPDGDHDLKDMAESSEWTKKTVDVASVLEDAQAINEMHDAVLGKKLFAVDAPDGEHDLEDVEEHKDGVERIIEEARLFENPDEVKEQQKLREDCLKEANKISHHDI
mmetsp:Transcript_7470/g.16297  ORF Transcript_7470/g.16297 Transcript_7470/m.16297 type:complete len:155 (+) Transcript_7470:306-770(+)|eukprot:CAMPEP_0183710084 /NCGR_PEP_ID=MMETSP0737-20130205/5942_1 /TAXON_ID=385413 /ORGANISM="Thalassiosira miniscula, Strain CCMP1093" /LENGTH=154 /DNA_ID=CAMNT_0025938307 /DNA_START=302 /DNA_END=766 /DNA_ORIENTATION=+